MSMNNKSPLFKLGKIAITLGAKELLERTNIKPTTLLHMHQFGEWGTLSAEDVYANSMAVVTGNRILSAYEVGQGREKVWVITETDRNATTLILPTEY